MGLDLEAIEREIAEACEWAVANGWTLEGNGAFGDPEDKTCCALGALGAKAADDPELAPVAIRRLGMTDCEYAELGRGFDGIAQGTDCPEFHAIGARLRARFLGAK